MAVDGDASGKIPPLEEAKYPTFSATQIKSSPSISASIINLSNSSQTDLAKNSTLIGALKVNLYPEHHYQHKDLQVPQATEILDLNISKLGNRILHLESASSFLGKPSVSFSNTDKQRLIGSLKHVLIAKFTHGRPSLASIEHFFLRMQLKGEFSISICDSKHVFIECNFFEDFVKLWVKRIWIIQGFPARVFKWSEHFHPSKESSITPVWIHLPGLPLYLFKEGALLKIGNAIGSPLLIDSRNLTRKQLGCASLCVEIDISKPLVDEIWINFSDKLTSENTDGFWQTIRYDKLPSFCSVCHHLGHTKDICLRKNKMGCEPEKDGHKQEELAGVFTVHKEKDKGNGWTPDNSDKSTALILPGISAAEEMQAGEHLLGSVQAEGKTTAVSELEEPAAARKASAAVELCAAEEIPAAAEIISTAEELQAGDHLLGSVQAVGKTTAVELEDPTTAGNISAAEGISAATLPAGQLSGSKEAAVGDSHTSLGLHKNNSDLGLEVSSLVISDGQLVRGCIGEDGGDRDEDEIGMEQSDVAWKKDVAVEGSILDENCSKILQQLEQGVSTTTAQGVQVRKGLQTQEQADKLGAHEAHLHSLDVETAGPENSIQQSDEETKVAKFLQVDASALQFGAESDLAAETVGAASPGAAKTPWAADTAGGVFTAREPAVSLRNGQQKECKRVNTQAVSVMAVSVNNEQEVGEKVDSKQEDVAKQNMFVKLNSAAEPFSPAASSAGQRKGAEMGMMGTPGQIGGKAGVVGIVPIERLEQAGQVAGNFDFSAFKARMYRLTGKEQYLARDMDNPLLKQTSKSEPTSPSRSSKHTEYDSKLFLKSKPAKASKAKAVTDPNKPKRPPTAFFVFMEVFRQEYKAKHPNNKAGPVFGKAGFERWKSLTDKEKAPYIAKADKRKAVYEKSIQAYNKKLSEVEDDDDEDGSGKEEDDDGAGVGCNELLMEQF